MKNRGYKIILVSDEQSEIRQLNLNRKLLYVIPAVMVAGLGILFYLLSGYYASYVSTKNLEHLQADNVRLVRLIHENEQKTNALIDQLEAIKSQDDLLRDMVKLPRIDDGIRKVGVGGANARDDESSLEYLLPGEPHGLHGITRKIDFMRRLTNLESLSYAEIYDRISADVVRYQCFPAIHPVALDQCHMTSDFGMRIDPFDRKHRFHEGDDFAGRWGTPVHATADGIVKASKYYGTFGNYIEIDHGYGLKTIYGHMSKRVVKRGDKVSRGDVIGAIGSTGKSTASHLHYGVKYKRKDVDPADYFFDMPLD